MKKLFFSVLFILLSFLHSNGQTFKPNDRWPYLLEDFSAGVIRMTDGTLLENSKLNICIVDGKLHYIENGKVLAADMATVFSAKIKEEIFLQSMGKMMKVLSETENGAVLELTSIDIEEMGKTEIGYGISSSTASSTKLTGIVSAGGLINRDLSDLMSERAVGMEYPVKKSLYLLVGRKVFPADKSSASLYTGISEKEIKVFAKQNKIKWNKTESLIKIIDFLNNHE